MPEPVEGVTRFLMGHTWSRIINVEHGRIAIDGKADFDDRGGWCVAKRVADQIGHDLMKSGGVALDDDGAGHVDLDGAVRISGQSVGHDLADESCEVNGGAERLLRGAFPATFADFTARTRFRLLPLLW